jgi:hypothetical protein
MLETAIISVCQINNNLSLEEAKNLPEYNGAKTFIFSVAPYIYKDAREKLTFTFKLNNCIIK